MLKLVGVQRKFGEYEGKNYDNVMLHCTQDCPTTPTIAGDTVEVIKIKAVRIRDVFDGLISTDTDWRSLIGAELEVFYDRYGSAQKITVKGM